MPDKKKDNPELGDLFGKAGKPAEVPAKFVSTTTVDVDEGLMFAVTRFEVVPDRFASDDDPRKIGEITGDVIETRAHRFVVGQQAVVACRSARLEALANEAPGIGDVVILVRNEDVGKSAGWGYAIERAPEEATS
jgi:hypothetical protein